MMIHIPFSVEGSTSTCRIELRDLSDRVVIAQIFQGECEPGAHAIDFDTDSLPEGLDAGIYVLHVNVDEEISTYPVQYMP